MQWTGSKSGPIPHTDESTSTMVKTYIDVKTSFSNDEEHFECLTNFGQDLQPTPGNSSASNIPSYLYRTSQSLNISCEKLYTIH